MSDDKQAPSRKDERVTNISRTGVFVRSKTPLPVGTQVNLRFTVIMDDIETIEGVGEITAAMTRLDHVTQGTAASAEESAAAGQDLQAQSRAVADAVDELRLLTEGANRS